MGAVAAVEGPSVGVSFDGDVAVVLDADLRVDEAQSIAVAAVIHRSGKPPGFTKPLLEPAFDRPRAFGRQSSAAKDDE